MGLSAFKFTSLELLFRVTNYSASLSYLDATILHGLMGIFFDILH